MYISFRQSGLGFFRTLGWTSSQVGPPCIVLAQVAASASSEPRASNQELSGINKGDRLCMTSMQVVDLATFLWTVGSSCACRPRTVCLSWLRLIDWILNAACTPDYTQATWLVAIPKPMAEAADVASGAHSAQVARPGLALKSEHVALPVKVTRTVIGTAAAHGFYARFLMPRNRPRCIEAHCGESNRCTIRNNSSTIAIS